MSAKLFNPVSKKFVNIDPKQMKTLLKAGWLSPNDESIEAIQKEEGDQEEIQSEQVEKPEQAKGEFKKKTIKEKIAEKAKSTR